MLNPYLDAAKPHLNDRYGSFDKRAELVKKYAWAVPSDEALTTISMLGPIVEIGAGTGYWAWMLQKYGADIIAYDAEPGDNAWCKHECWTEVLVGGPEKAAEHSDRALMLGWPPYSDDFAEDCVLHYTGNTVIHIGEGRYGCTGTEDYHDYLRDTFGEPHIIGIPHWSSIHDNVYIFNK